MEEVGIPELTPEQVEKLCEIGEKAARKHVLSKVPINRISDIEITVDVEGSKPITVNVDLQITLSPLLRVFDVRKLANESREKAFFAIEKYLRGIACKSKE